MIDMCVCFSRRGFWTGCRKCWGRNICTSSLVRPEKPDFEDPKQHPSLVNYTCCTSIELSEIHGRIMESDLNPCDAAWVLWM